MNFDPENHVNKLCADGMMLEGEGKHAEALALFQQAWDEAADNQEKFTAAHYIARHQDSVADKLKWDQTALDFALAIGTEEIKAILPSLYLNIAKCYEDLGETATALDHYAQAQSFAEFLPDDGYGNMIRAGIEKGLDRTSGVG